MSADELKRETVTASFGKQNIMSKNYFELQSRKKRATNYTEKYQKTGAQIQDKMNILEAGRTEELNK